MPLINCKDCNKEISDSAEACPNCGAPVVKVAGENEQQCPHCEAILAADATTCKCGAQKGYVQAKDEVYGKTGTIVMGIIVPGLVAPFLINSGGIFALLGAIFIIPIIGSLWNLMRGPRWYR